MSLTLSKTLSTSLLRSLHSLRPIQARFLHPETASTKGEDSDRGEVDFRPLGGRDEIERILWPDREDPKIDEM
ncbi:hypothetical protein EYZ11_009250 [Aspergillus tanneri]|uniref:Uncharacterized protein n=1 Tax=Aspergillus tanneri TaxID=1220188 RepID=A0A4S3J8K7_9EURO|nr:hypothetical protein EYZ11_009250 [Aspergillus tanneri]